MDPGRNGNHIEFIYRFMFTNPDSISIQFSFTKHSAYSHDLLLKPETSNDASFALESFVIG